MMALATAGGQAAPKLEPLERSHQKRLHLTRQEMREDG